MIPITWPFMVWGLNLVGPLQRAAGGYTHLLVAIDKFSKWIEARPITNIHSELAVLFFTDIIHRFGIPNVIITDNGTQFTGKKFLDFCDQHHIRVNWSTIAHPRTNGQVERANGMILQGLKPRIYNRLKKFGKKWVEEKVVVVAEVEPLGVPLGMIGRQPNGDVLPRLLRLARLMHQVEAAGLH